MQKNYPFFETTLLKPVNGIFQNNNASGKNIFQRFFVLLLILLANFSYSQLASEAFESGIPTTWAIGGTQGGVSTTFTNNWVHTPTGGYLASGAATLNPSTNNTVGTTAEYFMITPQFLTPADGQIRFFTKQGSFTNRGTVYQLRISTANQPDLSSFNVTLQSWTELQLNAAATTWEEKIVNIPTIPAGIPVYLAFVAITNQTGTTATSGDSWFIDNARVISTCSPVTTPMIVPSETGATISWTHPSATQFQINIVPTGAGNPATGIPTGNSYNAAGLEPSTNYDVYIIANCDGSTSSAWAGPFPFSTTTVGLTCTTSIVIPPDVTTAPYTLSSNLDQFYDGTTYVEMDSQIMSCQPIGQTGNLLLGNHVYLSYSPTTSGLIDITQTVNVLSGGGGNNCYNDLSSVFVFDGCAGVGTSAACLAAVATSSNANTAQISNFYAEAGKEYVFVISSPYQQTNPGAGVCFTFTISGSACPSPAVLTLDNLQQTSALASWNNVQNLVNAWEYIVLPSSSAAPTTAQSGTPTNTNSNNPLSGLSPGTSYNLFVRSICGTPGAWSAPLFFTTQCNPQTLPYYTGFTNASTVNGNPEPCWSVLNLNNDQYQFNYGSDWQGEPVAKLSTGNAGNQTNDMLISPQFNLDGVTQKRLRFKYQVYGNWGLIVDNPTGGPGSFEILLSTNGLGEGDFTTVLVPLSSYTTAYNYIEMIVPIPMNITGNINIAWKLPAGANQTGTQFYIDDVYVEDLPACSEPSYPTVTPGTLTSTSVEISWTNGYQNTQWELVAQPLGTGIPTQPGIIVSTNPYTLTNLTPSTRYEFYMRAYCSDSEQSIWVGPINFNTVCIAQFSPYLESFNDDDVTTKKFCWTTNNVNGDIAQWTINGTEASIQPQGQFFNPFVSYDDWLISVPVNVTGPKILRFKYRAATSLFFPTPRGNFEVLMSPTQDFATYTTLIPSHDFTNGGYLEDSVLFNGTGTFYIAFRMSPTIENPGATGIVMIDDVKIEDAPACPDPNPANLTATGITPTTANLVWTAGNTETQWQVVIQEPLSGIPTGSGTTVNTTPTYNATNLTENTAYEYYVRAVCSDSESSNWIGPYPFRTICNPFPTPFIETFDSNSQTETCWTIVNGNGDSDFWQLSQPANPIFGDQMAGLFSGNNGNNNEWLITPTLMARPGQRLRFYYKVLSSDFEEDLKVMLSTNGVATNQFSTILYENNVVIQTNATGTVAGSNTITLVSTQGVQLGDRVDIPGWVIPYGSTVTAINGTTITISGNADVTAAGPLNVTFVHDVINNVEVREMVINLTDITVPTNINLAFYTPFFPPNPWNYRGQYTFIDNVIVEDIPACPSVINVTTSNIIDVAADINWETTGSETAWEISVQPFGTPPPTGATLPEYLHTTTSHPYTVTGLTPSTLYEYYIRAVCSSSSQSEWIGPFEILTRCDYSNVCQYTISVTNGNTGQVTDNVSVMQNGIEMQALEFPGFGQPEVIDYTVFLCRGVEFSLYWNGFGSGVQYSEAQIVVKDEANNIVWTSPLGLGAVNTTLFTGIANCGTVTCPQPTNLAVSNQGVLSWTAGGSETQWEVFVQPLGNGTIPQTGIIVNTPTYTPVATDFTVSTASTYEYFVRAVCSTTDKSYWSGPKVFIRNDEPTNAVRLQVNTGTSCEVSGVDASFISATASTVPTSCAGINGGDIWYDFVATSRVHVIELSDFAPGSYYASAFVGLWPKIMMSLYEEQTDGSLVEKGCSENNSFVASYSTELVVGKTYKIRLKLDSNVPNDKTFHICITTPQDLCEMDAFNYDFEKLPLQYVTGVTTIIDATVTPGWRVNTDWGTMFFQEASNSGNVYPFSGGQCIQLTQDDESTWDESDPNIKGLYKDFDTSEITKMDYSFASATRGNGSTVQLFAGPPTGPFTLVTEDFANSLDWEWVRGTYVVPAGQNTTRFIFQTKFYDIGHVLDAANFKANVDINIDTADTTLDCVTTTMEFNANGVGVWEADANNPGTTTIANPTSGSTNVSGFNAPGEYVFHWKSRYCDKTVTITKQGTTETAQVVSPVIYCLNDVPSALTATVSAGNTVKWYTQAIGGVGSSTAPTPNTSVAGSSQMFYAVAVDANGCEGPRAEIIVQVNELPSATISGTTTVCANSTATITFNGTSNAVVTYTINGGSNQTITLDSTGVATVTTSALTTDTTYALVSAAITNGITCSQTLTGSAIVTVELLATATISGTTVICEGSTATITFNGTANATVTYTINGGANQTILLDGSGNATITTPALTTTTTYALVSVAASGTLSCSQNQTGSAVITVNPIITPVTDFTYEQTTYCSDAENILPQGSFAAGGNFSAPTGLVIDANTGEINIGNSTIGTYLVKYKIDEEPTSCNLGGESEFEIIITNGFNYTIDEVCENSMLMIQVANADFSLETANYTWSQANTTVGTNNPSFNVNEYLAQNPSLNLPLTFSVTVGLNGCSKEQNITIENNPCQDIPRGISPNNDQVNDAFDLTGYGVKEITIFNRYGTKVFSFSGNYSNQWKGQSDSGNELPDGTYFYTISTNDGTKTGWVYINREY